MDGKTLSKTTGMQRFHVCVTGNGLHFGADRLEEAWAMARCLQQCGREVEVIDNFTRKRVTKAPKNT